MPVIAGRVAVTPSAPNGGAIDELSDLSPQALCEALHNLRAHQIELESQNNELRRIQAELDTAHKRFFDFYDLAPVGYATVNETSTLLQANLTTAAMLGVHHGKLIGKALAGFMPAPDADRLYLMCRQALTSGTTQTAELRMHQSGGQLFWTKLHAMAATEDGAAVIRLVLVNITERRQGEEQLLVNKQFLDAILDSVPSQIAVLDRNGTILAVNKTWRQFALDNSPTPGEPARNTLVGANYLAICETAITQDADPDAAAARRGILSVMNGSASSFYLEYPCHSPTQQRWYSVAVTPLGMNDHAVVVTHNDITHRRQQEQAAKEASEHKFKLVTDSTSDGIVMVGANQQIEYVSPAYVKLLGYSEADACSRSPDMQYADIHRQDPDAPLARLEHAIEARQSDLLFAHRVQHRLGHAIWLETSAKLQYDAFGIFAGACFSTRDITERKQAKLALVEMNTRLTSKRRELRQLMAQNETALEKEKRHIAREVHDELGQVLTALRMNLSVVMHRHASTVPGLLDELQGMKVHVDRAIQGVRNVAANLRPAVLDMGLVPSIEWLCMELTRQGGGECALKGADLPIEIEASRAIVLFRIVQEALTNIRKYAQACEVEITLEQRERELSLQVCDNGPGFDMDAVALRGGLGLLGMRERAIALGGKLDVSSAPGQGTRVSVVIPLEPDQPGAEP